MSTTTTYDPAEATAYARQAAEQRLGRLEDDLEREHEEAVALAETYAYQLGSDGDPTDYPKPDNQGHQHGLAKVAREAVFNAWNETRDRRSVSYPWGPDMPFRWLVQEHLLDRVGEPVPMATLAQLGTGRKASATQVAEAAWSVQVATAGALRVRKVRVDGKVAWLVRVPVADDGLADLAWREGVHTSRLEAMSDHEREMALARPFKARVFEYPQEVL